MRVSLGMPGPWSLTVIGRHSRSTNLLSPLLGFERSAACRIRNLGTLRFDAVLRYAEAETPTLAVAWLPVRVVRVLGAEADG